MPRDASPDIPAADAIIKAIHESRVMVLIFSAHTNDAQHVINEVEAAVDRGIPGIPFRVESAVPEGALALHLQGRHWLDALMPPLERHLETLGETVRLILAHGFDAGPAPAARIPPQTANRASRRPYFYVTVIAAVVIVALIVSSGAITDIMHASHHLARKMQRQAMARNGVSRQAGSGSLRRRSQTASSI